MVTLSGGTKTAMGTLDGKIVTAQFAGIDKSNTALCSDHSLNLTATLDPLAEPRALSGTIAVEGCAACGPMEFRAVRQPKSPGGTR